MEIIDQTAKVVMLKGEGGDTIKSIDKTTTQGLVDIYTITLESGNKTTFNVTNGNGIKTIEKTSTSGLVDTYTITFDNGETTTFNVTNGEKGEKGDKGDTGPQGPQGPKGEKGDPGDGGGIANVDTELSTTSTNPVQNKAIAEGINSIQSQIIITASIERGAIASRAYNVGEFLVKNGSLWKATRDIAKGSALTPACIATVTIVSELSSINERLWQYKTTEFNYDYTQKGKVVSLDLEDYIPDLGSVAFIDGSTYIDINDNMRLPIGCHEKSTDGSASCYIEYSSRGNTSVSFYSRAFTGTFHVIAHYLPIE